MVLKFLEGLKENESDFVSFKELITDFGTRYFLIAISPDVQPDRDISVKTFTIFICLEDSILQNLF